MLPTKNDFEREKESLDHILTRLSHSSSKATNREECTSTSVRTDTVPQSGDIAWFATFHAGITIEILEDLDTPMLTRTPVHLSFEEIQFPLSHASVRIILLSKTGHLTDQRVGRAPSILPLWRKRSLLHRLALRSVRITESTDQWVCSLGSHRLELTTTLVWRILQHNYYSHRKNLFYIALRSSCRTQALAVLSSTEDEEHCLPPLTSKRSEYTTTFRRTCITLIPRYTKVDTFSAACLRQASIPRRWVTSSTTIDVTIEGSLWLDSETELFLVKPYQRF